MKEKWIIKLIKLLNKYIGDWQDRLYACYPLDEDFDKFFHTKDWEWTIEEAQVISKKFWFIQRLVENDKIDFYTILKENWTFRKEFYAIENKKEYERLIMLLSVEDNPIEFLISILK